MRLQELLNEIDALQAAIDQHGKLDDDVLKKVRYKLRLEWYAED